MTSLRFAWAAVVFAAIGALLAFYLIEEDSAPLPLRILLLVGVAICLALLVATVAAYKKTH